jgi:release factor glutamine methyltransferase
MDTVGSILAEAAAALRKAGIDEPRRRARRLIAGLLELSPGELVSHPERQIRALEGLRLRRSLSRMVRGEPLSRILGWREFWGLRFALSPDTLDPRPDSETLVEAVLARLGDRGAPLAFLDLGTGTGCLLLALLSEFPAASGIGIDLAEGAAATARRNAEALGLGHRARFAVGNWGSALSGRFDVIVANPPYIGRAALAELPPQVGRYDPRAALDGGEDGLAAYRKIAGEVPELLAAGGIIATEVGLGQAAAAAKILEAGGLLIDGIERDLAGVERCVVARMVESDRAVASEPGQKNLGMCRSRV